jgi:signal peptidase II
MNDAPSVSDARLWRWKIIGGVIVAIGLVADLWTKGVMQDLLGMSTDQPHGSERQIELIPGFLRFAGNWNPGVTFGMAAGWTQPILYFTVLACTGISAWLLITRNQSRVLHLALSLILAGAIGNLYDRVRFRMVRDFILVYWKDPSVWQWPAFNVADSMIVVGVGSILWLELFGRRSAPTGGGAP